MKVGIVSQWRNQGQATLSRHLRDALRALGHQSFVLARPTRDEHVLPGAIDHSDVWLQDGVEDASNYRIPAAEYLGWAERHQLDACFFNQNYQFDAIALLRARGVRTLGYFVWESFRREDVAPALHAYDVLYSLNRCTMDRYRRLGIDSPLVRWGIHPELLAIAAQRSDDVVRFFFPGGMQGPRKPLRAVVEAFRRSSRADIRLLLKGQLQGKDTEAVAIDDARIEQQVEDLPTDAYLRLFAASHVCLAPSRWEGTGLHFFEATAFGMPMITNDVPPMNEHFRHGVNARLVRSHVVGHTRSGIPSVDPDITDLALAIDELAERSTRERLAEGARRHREQLPWQQTVADIDRLLTSSG